MVDQRLLNELQALPVHSPAQHSRLSLDPRLARRLARVGSVPPETRTALLQYAVTAKWKPESRAVYAAVVSGYSTEEEIETVTGISLGRIRTAISSLTRKGMLRRISSV